MKMMMTTLISKVANKYGEKKMYNISRALYALFILIMLIPLIDKKAGFDITIYLVVLAVGLPIFFAALFFEAGEKQLKYKRLIKELNDEIVDL